MFFSFVAHKSLYAMNKNIYYVISKFTAFLLANTIIVNIGDT